MNVKPKEHAFNKSVAEIDGNIDFPCEKCSFVYVMFCCPNRIQIQHDSNRTMEWSAFEFFIQKLTMTYATRVFLGLYSLN